MSDTAANDADSRAALDRLAGRLTTVFRDAGYLPVDPPILQPAQVFLDRSGEDIRRRMYVFTDPGGAELCLRPDLTIPTCRLYLEADPAAAEPARLTYRGPAFRFQTQAPWPRREFTQVGIERIGAGEAEATDAEAIGLAIEAVRTAGLTDFTLEIGDLGLFGALVDVLDMPAAARARLKRHFWRPDYFRELVERLVAGGSFAERGPDRAALLSALDRLDKGEARAFIEDVLELADISPVGGRTAAEIAERLLEQAADAGAEALPMETAKMIDAFMAVSAPPVEAIASIRRLTADAEVSIEPQLAQLERRLELVAGRGIDLGTACFSTGFGRNMEYYTGFVFELRTTTAQGPLTIAGGGRYDTLLESLGAPKQVPAVGCAIVAERVLAAIEDQGGTP